MRRVDGQRREDQEHLVVEVLDRPITLRRADRSFQPTT